MNIKKTTLLCLFLIAYTTTYCQRFLEKQLPNPSNLNALFIGPLLKPTIHYGETPSNYNGKVLLFNHGYIDLNQLFFINNTFYDNTYNAGYQIAFVATTRGQGMWENGELLAESIDIITHKYGVSDVTIIAHSNGGKAAEVAMFSYNKKDQVKKVFALGTPFYGTYLADVSQQWWFNWIWSKTGLNEGSETSTTYYCKNIVRPYFDNLSTNQPSKFYVLGGSGFKSGHTILSPLMVTSGTIIYLVQGVNDGVTSYSSSLKPDANYIFDKGEAKLDHIDLAYGQYVWNAIEPLLNEVTIFKTEKPANKAQVQEIITSNYQILNSENEYDEIIIDRTSTNIELEVFHEKTNSDFSLFANTSKLTTPHEHKKTTNSSGYKSKYSITATANVILKGNSKFAAFAYFSEGPKMNYKVENKTIKISFDDIDNLKIQETTVNAIITKTSDLYGKKTNDDSYAYEIPYVSAIENFQLDTTEFEEGVYSVYITSKNSNFTRSIISGFTVGSLSKKEVDQKTITDDVFPVELKYNTINNEILFISNNNSISNFKASVYNLNGQKQLAQEIILTDGHYLLNENVNKLTKGLYILVIEKGTRRKSFKIIKN